MDETRPIHTYSAVELSQLFIKGKLKAVEIADHFLKRIEAYDGQIGAFLNVYHESALKQAHELDRKKSANEPLGKLAGVPIAVKDNIHIKNEISTCGSKFLNNYVAPFDASAIHFLKKEDALFIGKTNMDEFGMGSSTENSAYKMTYNPWNLKCTPGGSSGGSAAAVAARMAPIALGSDTGGSIRLPASFCGIFGFKPTYGRVSRSGLVAYGSSFDQIGPLANSIEDIALMMEVLGRPCSEDATSLQYPAEDYIKRFTRSIHGKRIGVPWEFLEGLEDEPKKLFHEAIKKMESLGATIVEVDLSILKYSLAVYYILVTAEASTNLARFDGIKYGQRSKSARTLEEVYDLSKEEFFGPEVKRRILLGTYVLSAGYQNAYYKKAEIVRSLIRKAYKDAFSICDMIATPVATSGAFEIGAIKDPLKMYLEDIYTTGINLAGLPAISIPNGFTSDHKPIGLQLVGRPRDDFSVVDFAHTLQPLLYSHQAIPPFVQ